MCTRVYQMASSHCGPSKINFDKQYLEQCYIKADIKNNKQITNKMYYMQTKLAHIKQV
jgi:hypothetical protein